MTFTTRLVVDTHHYAQNLTQDFDFTSLSTSKDLTFGLVGGIVLFAVFAQWIIKTYKFWQYPFVNKASWWNPSKAKENYLWNAQQLLVDGFHQSPKGYIMDTDMARTVLLSPEYANEVRSDPRLNFRKHNAKDFLGNLFTFQLFQDRKNFGELVNVMVRTKLTQSLGLITKAISEEMTDVLHHQWTEDAEWHAINLKNTMLEVIAQLSSRIFLGPELCRNMDWQRITIDYTVNIFMAVAAVKRYPKPLHLLVQWILPETRVVRVQMAEARRIIQPVIDQRKKEMFGEKKITGDKSTEATRKHTDSIQWLLELSGGTDYDTALAQLSLSMAAIHTTGDLITQVIYDICEHPELIQPLREEAIAVLGTDGWKRTSLYNLKLMDSVLKESQRIKPAGMVSMRRIATDNITLKDGRRIPKDSMIAVSGHWSWDKSIYENPDQFDGYRFYKMSQNPKTEQMSHLVATSPQHIAFGHGKHACPGRFFAANEVKIALVHILLKYDLKLDKSSPPPKIFKMGWMMQSDSQAKILVRRRKEEISLD
ncbi:cytochrome P450 monooxygenase, putative [Talaromyces marneffei ATCC 18224]|uniref:Cytochrome P450 monooxygenase, putative n=1 Tax=Talaromyces marneffei (strain ATCC 18224 / CBS 334.59 / QM 7333) TaxID=441960 RepID=B6QDS6_TALMQ|nr:cytochrome P450 monooxygenase, putative [Talaromyces marneffei ATCC 18224]